jgi:hypothetical protein
MISRYSYTKGDVTTITPEPLFYDSFYYAGDEMLNELIRKIMFFTIDTLNINRLYNEYLLPFPLQEMVKE